MGFRITHLQGPALSRSTHEPRSQQERSGIDETDLETSQADVKPVLRLEDSRTPPGKTCREGARGGCPRVSKAPRTPPNLTEGRDEQQGRARKR